MTVISRKLQMFGDQTELLKARSNSDCTYISYCTSIVYTIILYHFYIVSINFAKIDFFFI